MNHSYLETLGDPWSTLKQSDPRQDRPADPVAQANAWTKCKHRMEDGSYCPLPPMGVGFCSVHLEEADRIRREVG